MTTSTHPTDRDLTLHFLEILNKGRFEEFDQVFAPDIILDWPQTGERIRGIENARAIFSHYPGGLASTGADRVVFAEGDEREYLLTPMFTMVRAESGRDYFTAVVKVRYPDQSDWYVIFMGKSANGRLVHVYSYFAPVLEAPKWRAQWVEQIPDM